MNLKTNMLVFLALSIITGCGTETEKSDSWADLLEAVPAIKGRPEYIASPFVTAGDRVYMVGHQDGSFPELGWHIQGEMGGIWDHPIKLMDGFSVALQFEDEALLLDQASEFINYPFANAHKFDFPSKEIVVSRMQFVPDGMEGIVLQFAIENQGSELKTFNFNLTGYSDLRPTWLGERSGMVDHEDHAVFQESEQAWLVKDGGNEWYVLFGADRKAATHSEITGTYQGMGSANSLSYPLSIVPGERAILYVTVAGSYKSKEQVFKTFNALRDNPTARLQGKKDRYSVLESRSRLTVPDSTITETFEWLKYNCDWLVRRVPGIGNGITAGIPDYPWWFGVDSEYALKGYMAIGQARPVYETIALLDSVSNAVNGNGRIIHEMSTNGVVFNEGNINETPQFASLIWEIYRWNGDKSFLERYFPTVQKGLAWLLSENDDNKNLFPDGFGMMEIHGLDSEMIDVAAYTQRAFVDAAKMAHILGDSIQAREYEEKAAVLKERINKEFWSEEFDSYADFIGTDEQALHLIDDAIVRADTLNKPWAVAELKETAQQIRANPSPTARPFVLHHNWVVNTPMEMQIADTTRALKALKTAEKFVNPFGVFVTGIDRDETAGTDDGSFEGSKVFSYTGAVMTLPTGVQVVSENNYGRPDKALDYLKRMSRSFSYALPGSMYEVSPDYGMMTQAWNIYSYAVPIVQQFFGIQPEAAKRRILIRPQMPSEWDKASLENVLVADNAVSVYWQSTGSSNSIRLSQENPSWEIELVVPYHEEWRYDSDREEITQERKGNNLHLIFKGTDFNLTYGLSVSN